MKVRLRQVGLGGAYRSAWTTPLSVAVAVTVGTIAVLVWLDQSTGLRMPACVFRLVTGQPCPQCGGTRAGLALARGGWLEALAINPLATLAWLFGGVTILLWLATRRVIVVTGLPRRAAWVLGVALVLANWAWVWKTLPR